MVCVHMQVLGLFIVQITAAGCLYFLDPTNIANDRGLAAAGILLMLLNIAYVAAMLILIGINGASKTKQYTRTAFVWLRVSSARLQQSLSGRVSVTSGSEARRGGAEEGLGGHVGGHVGNGGLNGPMQHARGLKSMSATPVNVVGSMSLSFKDQVGHDNGM